MAWTRGEQRNPASPEPGFYALKLVKKGVEVGARILYSEGLWEARINGNLVGELGEDPELLSEVQKIWLFGRKIDVAEYAFLLARYTHAKAHTPGHPFANPDKPVSRRALPPIGS